MDEGGISNLWIKLSLYFVGNGRLFSLIGRLFCVENIYLIITYLLDSIPLFSRFYDYGSSYCKSKKSFWQQNGTKVRRYALLQNTNIWNDKSSMLNEINL